MWENHSRQRIDPMHPLLPQYYGYYISTAEINGVERRWCCYVPDDAAPSTAGVMLLPPGGVSIEIFMEQGNWVELCDTEECKERFIICVLESPEAGWTAQDDAYISAVRADFERRHIFCVHESKNYIVGYGDGGTAAQRAVMLDPAAYAGLACVDAPSPDPDCCRAAGEACCVNLHGFSDDDGHIGLKKADIPVPAWFIFTDSGKREAAMPCIEKWIESNGASPALGRPAPDTDSYVRQTEPAYPMNRDREACRVWTSVIEDAAEGFGRPVNRRIWKDFLSRVRRWMSEPGGSLRLTEDPLRDLNCEYRCEMVDGWMREWYVYVPRNLQKPAPLVLICHGYTCTGEIYLGSTGWNQVADAHGFIVVAATACSDIIEGKGENRACKFENARLPAWNIFGKADRPDEIAFFQHLIRDTAAHDPVDMCRIYATGHSWGSMMTQYLAMAMGDVFAAVAPCSGVLFDEHDETMLANPQIVPDPDYDVPIWMFVGEAEHWLFPHIPEGDNAPARSLRLWWRRNHLPGEAPDTFDTGWTRNGRWNDLTYEKAGVPVLKYTWVRDMPHATMPEMSHRIWTEFFSRMVRITRSKAD